MSAIVALYIYTYSLFMHDLYGSLMKNEDQRPNYEQLQKYSFFEKYNSAPVDVIGWYKTVR